MHHFPALTHHVSSQSSFASTVVLFEPFDRPVALRAWEGKVGQSLQEAKKKKEMLEGCFAKMRYICHFEPIT